MSTEIRTTINENQETKNKQRTTNMKIGITFSAFDLLHAGHITMLEDAKRQCDYLICGLQTDPTLDRPDKNKPYTLAMARTNDPNSATSQFFINLIDNSFLNYTGKSSSKIGYCVFGSVIQGKDIVDKIGKYKTQSKNGQGDVPIKKVVIKSIKQR